MTGQQTDLSPRELDAALAERLFGLWAWLSGLPDYSSTGDGMLLVLEAMRERGYWWKLNHQDSVSRAEVLLVSTVVATAEDRVRKLPRAVALAALAALEKEASEGGYHHDVAPDDEFGLDGEVSPP